MAETPEEAQRRRRRQRLVKGLAWGGAAIGIPALFNAVVSRRAQRERAPIREQKRSHPFEGGDIVYRQTGEGPPIVFLHSLGPGHSGGEWRECAALIASRHRILVPDLPGWGDSAKVHRPYAAPLYVRWLSHFLRGVIDGPSILVAAGHSGAYAAAASLDPENRVRALGLVAPVGLGRQAKSDFRDRVLHRILRAPVLGTSALNYYTSRKSLRGYLEEVYHDPTRVTPELFERYYRTSHLPGAHRALAALLAGACHHPVRGILAEIEIPVWLTWGRASVSPAIESADLWLQGLSRARFEVFEDCGMLPHAERPSDFAERLLVFVETVSEA